jgi:hypothetical protein
MQKRRGFEKKRLVVIPKDQRPAKETKIKLPKGGRTGMKKQ